MDAVLGPDPAALPPSPGHMAAEKKSAFHFNSIFLTMLSGSLKAITEGRLTGADFQ